MPAITEEKLGKYFANAFREVVLPVLEDMQERMATKDDVEELKVEIDKINRKLSKKDECMDRHSKRLKNHD